MKLHNLTQLITSLPIALVAVLGVTFLMGGSADARTQWVSGGVGTTTTPVFNEFYDVPYGTGDEADFVRVRPNGGTNADYVSTLDATCNVGDSFDVRTYIHNGADPSFNDTTAVARDTAVAMNVSSFGAAANSFTFTSSISASNAAGMTDQGVLNCADDVVLRLVPASVQVYSQDLGFYSADDSAVNGSMLIGSREAGSGDVYACWDDRIIVVYEVVVEAAPEPVTPVHACVNPTMAIIGRRTVFSFDAVAENGAVFDNAVVSYSADGSQVHTDTQTSLNANNQIDSEFTFASDARDIAVDATLTFTVDGGTTVVTEECGDGDTLAAVTTPTTTPATGAGSMAAMFAGLAAAGTVAHRALTLRKNS